MSKNMRTVVLMGGESSEREVSLQSGENILHALAEAGIEAEGYDWHPSKLNDFLSHDYERVFIALHGGSGENGAVQALLDMLGVPYTGVRMLPAALCMDKLLTKKIVGSQTDVLVPECRAIRVPEAQRLIALDAPDRWQEAEILSFPMVVKPARNGSSVGVSIVESCDELDDAVSAAALDERDYVLFEQYIEGHELTVAMLNGKALGVCKIVPKKKFYDYEAKYLRDDTEYLVPSGLGDAFDRMLMAQAEEVAEVLECQHGVVRIDFLADHALNPYFLEVNTVPGMTAHSLVPKIAAHAGIDFPSLCKVILEMAQ